MRFLFFPLDLGIAHISRSLALAEELHIAGHNVAIAIPSEKQPLYEKTPVHIFDIPPVSTEKGIAVVNAFLDSDEITRMIHDERKIIKQYQPDWIIVDFRLSSLITALQDNIPIACLTGSGGLPHGCKTPNPLLPQWIFHMFSPIIDSVVQKMMSSFYMSLENVSKITNHPIDVQKEMTKIPFIVPEIPNYLPPMDTKLQIKYVGHMTWNGFQVKKPEWLNKIKPDGRTIYLTFGGTGFDKDKMIALSRELLDNGLRVVISCGTIAGPSDFPHSEDLFVESYLPGSEISKKVDLVVCHGGYGTAIEAVLAGVPVVSIPFNPDQALHALRFRELGFGEVVANIKLPDYISLLNADFQKFEKIGKSTSITSIIKTVNTVLSQKESYTHKIRLFKKKYQEYVSTINVAKQIESFSTHS